MNEWTIFGERLSHIMREYDVSLRELSRRTGTTLTTLHRYATCKRVPKATEILKCANALGITCDYLLGLSDDPHLTGKGERIVGKRCGEPERKQGEWIVWGGMDIPENHGRHKCSLCGEFAPVRYEKPLIKEYLSDFCPNCGADMRGGDAE